MIKIDIQVVQGREGLSSIKEDWHQITETLSKKRFFHFYEWYQSYLENLEPRDSLVYFFVLYKNKKSIAIFPLKRIKKKILGFHFNALEIPSHDFIDLSDFICSDMEDIGQLFGRLLEYLSKKSNFNWDFILIPHSLEDSKIVKHVEGNNDIPLIIREDAGQCGYIQCMDFEKLQKKLSKSFKANLRNLRNRLNKNNMKLIFASKTPEIFNNYNEFLDIEASGWKGRANTAIKCFPEITEYYRSLINNFSGIINCEINLLGVNKEYIAGQLCMYVDDTCYLLKIGYKEKYSHFSPGNILLETLIKRLAKENKIKYVNLVTGSKWNNRWKPENYKVYRILNFNRTFTGIFAFFLSKIKQTARPFFNQYIKPVIST